MNRKVSLGAAIAFMFVVSAMVFSATMIFAQNNFNQKSADLEQRREMYAKFSELDRAVRGNYSRTINETVLMDSVAQGYIKGIGDRYGAYLSAEEVKRLAQNKEGEDVGIGAVLEISPEGYLLVTEVYPDSPAQVAEITAGDLIVKIDDTDLTPDNVEYFFNAIQGAAGTKVSLVVRKGAEDVIVPDLTRRVVAVPSVYSRLIAETSAGYISIRQFNENTADQFNREFNKMIDAGATCLIFDVRDNKGGWMNSAVRILDKLVPEGVIYSLTYRDGTTEVGATSDANEIALPMVVIANGGTASAAELFAADLRDFGKASIIGQTTFGKGVMLDRIRLSDGSVVDLTVALFNPASGVNFDGTGIKPDYEVQPVDADWTKLDETLDPQLKKALEVVLAMEKAEATVQAEASSSAPGQSQPEPQSSAPEPQPQPEPSSSTPEPPPPSSESSEPGGDSGESGPDGESGGNEDD